MAALQCEICGGKLVAKSGGLFECEFCGMQYDKTRIQEMVQEIKGTVRVEGTVEVKGTVAIDTQTKKDNLLKRIAICAEDRDFKSCKDLTEELLKLSPECGEAYLWQTAAKFQCVSIEELFQQYVDDLKTIQNSTEWKNALRYLAPAQADSAQNRMAEAIRYWERDNSALKERFRNIQPAQNLLFFHGKAILGLQADGTVRVTYTKKEDWLAPVAKWTGVKKLFVDDLYTYALALCWDGRILGVYKSEESKAIVTEVLSWAAYNEEKIIDLLADGSTVVALFEDGEVCCTKDGYDDMDKFYFGYACDWEDVEQLYLVRDKIENCNLQQYTFYGKTKIGALDAVLIIGVTGDGRVYSSAACRDLDDYPQFEKQFVHKWEQMRDIAKIDGVRKRILFRDGTLFEYGHINSDRKWLDFHISDTGCVMDGLFHNPAFMERDLVAIAGCFALRADGTVLRARQLERVNRSNYDGAKAEEWTNIVALYNHYCNGAPCILGIREDGRVLLSWSDAPVPEIHVDGWKLFDSLQTFAQERSAAEKRCIAAAEQRKIAEEKAKEEAARIARQKQQEQERIAAERCAAGLCRHCGGTLKGFIFKKCVSCGQPKDY